MHSRLRPLSVATIGAIVLAILVGLVPVGEAAAADPVVAKATVSTVGDLTVVDITVTNNTSGKLTYLAVHGQLPADAILVGASPRQFQVTSGEVIWFTRGLAAGKKLVGLQYKLQNALGPVSVYADYVGATKGTAYSDPIAMTNASSMVAATVVPAAKPTTPAITVTAKPHLEGDVTVVDVSVKNNTSGTLKRLEIDAVIPAGSSFVGATPDGRYRFAGNQVTWIYTKSLGAGKTVVGFQYRLRGAVGSTSVNVDYDGASKGSGSSGTVPLTK